MALERVSSRKFARFKRSSDEDDKIPNYPVFVKSEDVATKYFKKILSESIGDEEEQRQRRLTEKATPAMTSQCDKATPKTTGHSHCSIPTCLGRTQCAQEATRTEQVGHRSSEKGLCVGHKHHLHNTFNSNCPSKYQLNLQVTEH